MEKNKIWLSSPHMSGREMKYIESAFDTNWITQNGPNIDAFEENLEEYLGENSFVTALTSGTAAIHLALRLLEVQKDDFVICQSLTFVASANPILYMGAIPVFVDSELETWNLCPNFLEEAVQFCLKKGKKPKAIIAVTLYGMPYKIEEVTAISKKYNIPVIEDSAEALGSKYKGRKCGTFGDISIISFNGNKIITTSGGGALVSHKKALKIKAKFFATQAKDEANYYQHSELGYNYRMSNVSAGIGRGQLEVLEERIAQKRENFRFYKNLFKNVDGIKLFTEPTECFFSNYWLNAIIVDKNATGFSNLDFHKIMKEHHIETRPLWKPMHLQPLYEKYIFFGENISSGLFENGLCLASGTNMSDEHKDKIRETFAKISTRI